MITFFFSPWLRGDSISAHGLLVLFLSMPGFALAGNEMDPRIHEWLGWGEFDSAVVALDKAVQDTDQSALDAATRAKYWSWLGIAFHGRNQAQAGDSAFRRALAIQADFEIEKQLVTRELARRFHDLAESQKQANLKRDSILLAKSRETAPEPPLRSAPPPAVQPTSSRGTALWWKTALSVGAAGALIAGGTYAYLAWNSTPEKTPKEKIWDIPPPK